MKRIATISALALVVFAATARAEERPNTGRPVLSVVQVASDATRAGHEKRFVDELALILSDLGVDVTTMTLPDFGSLPLTQQLAAIEPFFANKEAIAIAWLGEISPGRWILSVVVWSTGRAMVRLLEAEKPEGFETDLALAASELLGAVYLFEPRLRPDDPMRKVAEAAREKAVALAPSTPPKSPSPPLPVAQRPAPAAPNGRNFSAAALGELEIGAGWGKGPRLGAGGAIAVGWEIANGFAARLGVSLLQGALEVSAIADVRALVVSPALGLERSWSFGRFSLGPSLELVVRSSTVAIETEAGDSKTFHRWQVAGRGGLEIQCRVARSVGVAFAVGVIATPQQDIFSLERTGEEVLSTYRLGLFARLGMVLHTKI